jgi:hypothetical protein
LRENVSRASRDVQWCVPLGSEFACKVNKPERSAVDPEINTANKSCVTADAQVPRSTTATRLPGPRFNHVPLLDHDFDARGNRRWGETGHFGQRSARVRPARTEGG